MPSGSSLDLTFPETEKVCRPVQVPVTTPSPSLSHTTFRVITVFLLLPCSGKMVSLISRAERISPLRIPTGIIMLTLLSRKETLVGLNKAVLLQQYLAL